MNTPLITKRIREVEAHLLYANRYLTRIQKMKEEGQPVLDEAFIHGEKQRVRWENEHEWLMARTPQSIEFDAMPAEVATEMLADPKAHLSNRQRKACFAARETRYVAKFPEAKSGTVKLARRFSGAKLTQLGNWLRRADFMVRKLRKGLAKAKAEAIADEKLRADLSSMLNFQIINAEISRGLMRDELKTRLQ